LTASGLLLVTPLVLRHPFFRTPLGRVIEIGGAAALIARGAAIIRDWEPAPETRGRPASSVTVPPATA
jgi:hypothetical protein